MCGNAQTIYHINIYCETLLTSRKNFLYMNWNPTGMMEELVATTQKLTKGYETLQKIESVELATTPKELVWQCDKVKMYHYLRDTPAKCKTPVLVSFAMLNRQDVLDLQPDRSLMKKLVEE